MYGDKVIVGYSIINIDQNNKMCLPRYTCCEPGDKLLIIPEDDKLVICSSIVLENYMNKIKSINNHKEEKELLCKLRELCKTVLYETIVDNQNRIDLSGHIDFLDKTVEIKGSKDKIIISGNFTYPSLYRKRV